MTDYFFNSGPKESKVGQLAEQTLPSVGAAIRRLETFEVMTRRIDESKGHLESAEKKFQEARGSHLAHPVTPPTSVENVLVHLNDALQFLHLSREALHSFGSLIGEGPNRNEHFARCLNGIESQIKRIETITTKLTKSKTLSIHGTAIESLKKATALLASSLKLTLGEAVMAAKEDLSKWVETAQKLRA